MAVLGEQKWRQCTRFAQFMETDTKQRCLWNIWNRNFIGVVMRYTWAALRFRWRYLVEQMEFTQVSKQGILVGHAENQLYLNWYMGLPDLSPTWINLDRLKRVATHKKKIDRAYINFISNPVTPAAPTKKTRYAPEYYSNWFFYHMP